MVKTGALLLLITFIDMSRLTGGAPGVSMGSATQRQHVKRPGRMSLILTAALSLQGCLAIPWLAAIGVDSVTPSSLTFWPFEQSWVAPKELSNSALDSEAVTSVAVLPVEGDGDMAARLSLLLKRETMLRVESPAITPINVSTGVGASNAKDAERSAIAQQLTCELGVETILVGRVAGAPSHPSEWGSKEEGMRRLYLYLVHRDGRLLWKDELPFTVVKGAAPPAEESVQSALSQHLMEHVRSLQLDALGYLPTKRS